MIGNHYDVTGNEDICNIGVFLKSYTFTEINCIHHNQVIANIGPQSHFNRVFHMYHYQICFI